MAVDDLWYLSKRGPDGERLPSKRHGRGKRWRVRWTDDEGRLRTMMFERKADADRKDAAVRVDLDRGQYVDPTAGRVRFREYAEQWRANQVHRQTTQVHVGIQLRRHVYPVLGDRTLSVIRPTQIQAWVRGASADLAPSTVEVVYRYLSAIFKAAVADRLIHHTPCVGVKLPKREPKRVDPLPTEAVHVWMDAMPARYEALVALGAGSGLRGGEMLGLEVEKVDFLRRTVRVDQQLVLVNGEPPFLAPPKTAASYRTVPIGRFVIDALAAHLARFPVTEVEIVDKTGPRPVTRPARLVFLSARGLPIRRNVLATKTIVPALRAARRQILGRRSTEATRTLAASLDDAGLHALRHYFASLLIGHGASVKEVQERLGHASASETLDTYSHLWPASDDRTRAAVDAVLGSVTEPAAQESGG